MKKVKGHQVKNEGGSGWGWRGGRTLLGGREPWPWGLRPLHTSHTGGEGTLTYTGGEGSLTQWVHCEFVVSFEAIRPVITQQACGEFF